MRVPNERANAARGHLTRLGIPLAYPCAKRVDPGARVPSTSAAAESPRRWQIFSSTIRNSPLIPKDIPVSGFIYDVRTGQLNPVAYVDVAVGRVFDHLLDLVSGGVEDPNPVFRIGGEPDLGAVRIQDRVVGRQADVDRLNHTHRLEVDDGGGVALLVVAGALALIGGVELRLIVGDAGAPGAGASGDVALVLHRVQVDLVNPGLGAGGDVGVLVIQAHFGPERVHHNADTRHFPGLGIDL